MYVWIFFIYYLFLYSQRGFMGTIAGDYNRQHSVNRRKSPAIPGDHAEAYCRVMSTWPSLMVGTAEGDLPKLFSLNKGDLSLIFIQCHRLNYFNHTQHTRANARAHAKHVHTRAANTRTRARTRTHTRARACIRVLACARVCACLCALARMRARACMCACLRARVHVFATFRARARVCASVRVCD